MYNVDTMFVDSCTYKANGKTYTRHLLRESFRENRKVQHRTLANLSRASNEEILAIKLALKNKHQLEQLGNIDKDIDVKQGLAIGAVMTLWQLAQRIGWSKRSDRLKTPSRLCGKYSPV